jgi:hypothetical protein
MLVAELLGLDAHGPSGIPCQRLRKNCWDGHVGGENQGRD